MAAEEKIIGGNNILYTHHGTKCIKTSVNWKWTCSCYFLCVKLCTYIGINYNNYIKFIFSGIYDKMLVFYIINRYIFLLTFLLAYKKTSKCKGDCGNDGSISK